MASYEGFTWADNDSTGLFFATNGSGGLGLKNQLYLSVTQKYGSAYILFYFDYKVIGNKLRISLKEAKALNNEWTHRNWIVRGSITANGTTIFNGELTRTAAQTADVFATLTPSGTIFGDISYPDISDPLVLKAFQEANWLTTINFKFSFYIKHDIYVDSWKGWTNDSPMTASGSTTHRYNIITFRSNWWGENLSDNTKIYNLNNLASKPVRMAIVKNNNKDGVPMTQTYWGKNTAVNSSTNYHATLFEDNYTDKDGDYNVCAQIHGWTLDISEEGYYNVHLFPGFTGGGSRWGAHTINASNQVGLWYLGEKLNYGGYAIAWLSNKAGTVISDEPWGSVQRAWVGSMAQNTYGAEANWGVTFSFGKGPSTSIPQEAVFIQDSNTSGVFNRYAGFIYNEETNQFEKVIPYIYINGAYQIIR